MKKYFTLLSILSSFTYAEKFEWQLIHHEQVINKGIIYVHNDNKMQILNETTMREPNSCNKNSKGLWNKKEITATIYQTENEFNAEINIMLEKIPYMQGICLANYTPFTHYQQSHIINFNKTQFNNIFIDNNTQFTINVIP